jgi:hypothetical protein
MREKEEEIRRRKRMKQIEGERVKRRNLERRKQMKEEK